MSQNKEVLVYCEAVGGKLSALATELLGAGSRLAQASGSLLSAVLLGGAVSGLAPEAIAWGAQKVYIVEDAHLTDFSTEAYLTALEKVIQQATPGIILLGQTAAGRDLAPWLAFRLNSAATMDCLSLEIDSTGGRMRMTRPVYGGNAQAIQVCETDPQIATLRSQSEAPLTHDAARQGQIVNIAAGIDPSALKTRVLERQSQAGAGIKLEDARVIVAGGRGMGSAAGFQQLEEIAVLLKGAVGATRPPCDNKWTADNRQIGLTGKVVSPDLYIAVGLSGASQHLSGCSSAKVIVAINKDPEANIFKAARYGIVADWKAVLPAFCARLKEEG